METTSNENGVIVGIDLGTTNSVVAAIMDGKPTVLAEDGERALPSVVGLDENRKLITGQVARNQLAVFPERTIASVKRRMGQMDQIPLGETSFTPPEISAMILRRLRERACNILKTDVSRAVITVPAFFDDAQRQATKEAGELAGFNVERIINEPTAATLVYHAGSQDAKTIVVYDFGGGTFDVSIVRMENGVVEVLCSKGDTELGGDDIDHRLLDYVADKFKSEHDVDLRENVSARYRLLLACEQAKMQLSTDEEVEISEEFIAEKDGKQLNLVEKVSRSEFEDLIAPLVDQTIEKLDEALREAQIGTPDIDDLVLVGGSTRIPLVQQRLRDEFSRDPSHAVDPDMAVALGAATQAGMIQGQSVGPVLIDVTGHTLGIEVLDDSSFLGRELVFSPIIRRNTALPATYEESYRKTHPDQSKAEIHVLQGESPDVERNQSLGKFMLDLEKGGGHLSKIVVRFDLTLDGTLKVRAIQSATGKSEDIIIENALTHFQNDAKEQAEARLGELFENSDEIQNAPTESQTQWRVEQGSPQSPPTPLTEKYPAAQGILARIAQLKLADEGDEDAEEIRTLAKQLESALADDDKILVKELCEELDDILFYVQ